MSHYSRALELEEVFGPPQVQEPSPDDPRFHGIPLPARDQPETFTLEQRREMKIAAGECPLPGCFGGLDEDFYCAGCGNVSLPRVEVGEDRRAVSPRPPELLDEFAPAQIEDEAA